MIHTWLDSRHPGTATTEKSTITRFVSAGIRRLFLSYRTHTTMLQLHMLFRLPISFLTKTLSNWYTPVHMSTHPYGASHLGEAFAVCRIQAHVGRPHRHPERATQFRFRRDVEYQYVGHPSPDSRGNLGEG